MSKAKIMVSCGELQIWLEIDSEVYPDQLTDLCNRAAVLFGTALLQAKSSGVNVMAPDGDFDDEEIQTSTAGGHAWTVWCISC